MWVGKQDTHGYVFVARSALDLDSFCGPAILVWLSGAS